MKAAQGILTVRGGMTSHAAVVARGMGKCCVSGCGAIAMDEENKQFTLAGKTFHEGDWLSIDGSTGKIYDGAIPTVDASIGGEFGRVMGWADQYRRLKVRTNADTPHDAAQARTFGAEGIGLCRTEHMFFDADRIPAIREMICSDTAEQRAKALAKLEPMQQSDFEGIYEAMEGLPVTIRFLDPPLHEFVPTDEADIEQLARDMGKTVAEIKAIIAGLHEFNPMMGHRGCRLAVTYPEIAAMQTRAVIKAALNVQAKHPEWTMVPEIMIPLVGEAKELKYVKGVVTETADAIIKEAGSDMKYLVGTMIEIPRAALTADEIAKQADFFSLRHQRPDSDDLRLQPRRRRQVPGRLLRQEDLRERSLRQAGPDRRGPAGGHGLQAGPLRQPRPAPGRVRRARRRPLQRGVLPPDGPGLRVLLSLPCAHRPPRCRSGRHQGREVRNVSKPHTQKKHRPGSLSRGGVSFDLMSVSQSGAFRRRAVLRLPPSVRAQDDALTSPWA